MSIKTNHESKNTSYYCTFTCYKWIPLFKILNQYNEICMWLNQLSDKGHHILAYVIMPNHIHLIIHISENGETINKIISNGKRFLAYSMVKKMKANNISDLLKTLSEAVSPSDKAKGSKHRVFEPSFHCKECLTSSFLSQKLNYIHDNPTAKHWKLCKSAENYSYSSAQYYLTGVDGPVKVTHFLNFFDTVLG